MKLTLAILGGSCREDPDPTTIYSNNLASQIVPKSHTGVQETCPHFRPPCILLVSNSGQKACEYSCDGKSRL